VIEALIPWSVSSTWFIFSASAILTCLLSCTAPVLLVHARFTFNQWGVGRGVWAFISCRWFERSIVDVTWVMVWQFPRLRLLCFLLLIVRNEIFPGPFLAASCRSAQDSFTDAVCREAIWQQIVWIWAMFWICCVVSDWVSYERSTGGRLSVGKSSRRRDPVEVLRTFWNIFEYVRFVISCIYSLVCNGIRFIPSQTNVRLGFCDTEDVIWSKYFFSRLGYSGA